MTWKFLALCLLVAAGGCAWTPDRLDDLLPADALLLGEQHDAALHQQRHRQVVDSLAARGALAAVAIEMAEQGASTEALPRDASESAVREALKWNEPGWPWAAYGPVVMAAVRSGVPVLGANLPRAQMRAAMGDAHLDSLLDPLALAAQREAMRDGHCGLLPETQLGPMARIQVARDRAMARTVAGAVREGKVVVLVAGSGHVDALLGVPRHMARELRVRIIQWPSQPPKKDYCAELKKQMTPTM